MQQTDLHTPEHWSTNPLFTAKEGYRSAQSGITCAWHKSTTSFTRIHTGSHCHRPSHTPVHTGRLSFLLLISWGTHTGVTLQLHLKDKPHTDTVQISGTRLFIAIDSGRIDGSNHLQQTIFCSLEDNQCSYLEAKHFWSLNHRLHLPSLAQPSQQSINVCVRSLSGQFTCATFLLYLTLSLSIAISCPSSSSLSLHLISFSSIVALSISISFFFFVCLSQLPMLPLLFSSPFRHWPLEVVTIWCVIKTTASGGTRTASTRTSVSCLLQYPAASVSICSAVFSRAVTPPNVSGSLCALTIISLGSCSVLLCAL